MRWLLIPLLLVLALPATASREEGGGSKTVVSQGGDDTLAVAVPRAPDRTSLTEAHALCEAAPGSVWCIRAEEETRIPLLCRRFKGVFGIPDLPFVGRYCLIPLLAWRRRR